MTIGMDTEKRSARGTSVGCYDGSDGATWWLALSNPEPHAGRARLCGSRVDEPVCLLHHMPPDLSVRAFNELEIP